MLNNSAIELKKVAMFFAKMSKALIESGCSSNRLESLLERLGRHWAVSVEPMAMPTGVFISLSKDGETVIDMVRIKTWSVNLDRIQKINDLVIKIVDRNIDIVHANIEMEQIITSKPPYSEKVKILSGAGSSCGLIYFLGGELHEVFYGIFLGLILGALKLYFSQGDNRRHLTDFAIAFVIAILSLTLSKIVPHFNADLVMTGCVVVNMPGLIFLNAIHEIALKNLLSGTSKLMEAFISAMSISFGLAAAIAIFKYF